MMRVESRHLNGIVVICPDVYADHRGFFMESFRADHAVQLGLPGVFVQDNHSRSVRGVVRGLHFQYEPQLGKLMRVTVGSCFLVAVDIRAGSPTLGKWFGVEVSAENKRQVWAPPGFARGFCVTSEVAELQYKCTSFYNPSGESGILWNDPAIGITWPVSEPVLSAKDAGAQTLEQWLANPAAQTFRYTESD
jgi:dTDP-4-dehydrorhamnose 3,5-epimerase